jgi:MFS family permease
VLFVIYGAHFGLTEPAEKALVKDLSPVDVRGRAYGYYNFVLGISAIPAGLLTGWLWQTWSPFAALATGACIAAAASIALALWSRARPVAA